MSATTIGNLSEVAKTASQKAFASNTVEGHKSASEAHNRAAGEALAEGDGARAKRHRRSAQKHLLEAHRLASEEKVPKQGGKANAPDEPDHDGKDENPLTTWAKS